DFVPRGGPLFRVRGSLSVPQRSAAALSVILDRERSHEFEPAFGLRKLGAVATRSIYSSPFQDPTTSVQSINAIHDILRRLAPREFPSGRHHDAHGHVRLGDPGVGWGRTGPRGGCPPRSGACGRWPPPSAGPRSTVNSGCLTRGSGGPTTMTRTS